MTRRRILILASDCNPEWPSLPVVGYKYAVALSRVCDVVVATQVRNRPNILKLHPDAGEAVPGAPLSFVFIDTEYIAAPLHRLSRVLRGGTDVAWSTGMIMAYPSYVEFERQVWKRFREALRGRSFDIVHRITPMSPTMPSYMAGRGGRPFVLGPLNGNLDWPKAFAAEQKRERESLRRLRALYRYMPFARRTFARSAAVLAAFRHTIDDLDAVPPDRIVMFPEVGYDDAIFHPPADTESAGEGPLRFLFAGRLVPYKLPEVAVRAFVGSPHLGDAVLHVVGDGPELPRLQRMVEQAGAADRVIFEGRLDQAGVAEKMRGADVFVFPSIRELGAGVVVEAMACGMLCIVVDYGGPADLVAPDRGVKVPMAPLEDLVTSFRHRMEQAAERHGTPAERARRRAAADHARDRYLWARKADLTAEIYEAVLAGEALPAPYART
ncbi:hypothetical protein OCGS_2593 [Oceaniovalibus guishaninsula JLT2003]|uniref:Glycosyl transferase family 1 domain-containing protein n=1 Tax=Oceaniovalibus guishaninsula JLT2003 TaxID=1231392 RepID=K2GKH9_9RHOB|nr:glycosyltransferase [Oceaniovalibus guishaninsula]EKE43256.1 hypothetical protein OCGS_2593 [Oceaniovalibus guishaninsula JLT2003]